MFYFYAISPQSKLEKLLDEKPDEVAESGSVFDRETYLREVEEFEEVEVVVSGRNSVRVGSKAERAEKLFLHYSQRWAKVRRLQSFNFDQTRVFYLGLPEKTA